MANNIPQGYYWIRELVPDVQWDEATRTIKLPGGPSVPLSATLAKGGKAYVTPQQLSSWYATYQQPSNITPEAVQQKADIFKQIMQPQADYWKQYLDTSLRNIQRQADVQRGLAEAAYEASRRALQRQETDAWNAIVKSAMARGLGASPLTSYEQRKVAETYAPEYQQLETNRAAQLANIAAQAAQAADELALKGREMEANWASQMAQYALDALAQEAQQQQARREYLADFFAQMGQQDWERALQEASLTGYYQGRPTWEREYGTKSLQLEREKALWDKALREAELAWEREYGTRALDIEAKNARANMGTQTERERLATAELFNAALARYDELVKKGYKYPLYFTISTVMSDPKWRRDAMISGADVKAVVDALILSKTKPRMSPEQYFATPSGSKLKDRYDALVLEQMSPSQWVVGGY